eukprot:4139641-Prymnesium_polylepis.2
MPPSTTPTRAAALRSARRCEPTAARRAARTSRAAAACGGPQQRGRLTARAEGSVCALCARAHADD